MPLFYKLKMKKEFQFFAAGLFLFIQLFSPNSSAGSSIGIVSSGGVSLGAYEAGILNEFLKAKRSQLPQDLKVVMGASAGGVNGLLTAFEACSLNSDNAQSEDLLWKMWIPVGLDELQSRDSRVAGMFKRDAIAPLFAEMRKLWNQGFDKKCNFVFGATVTRETPLVEELRPGLTINRQPEIFLVRVRGRGPGRPPQLSNYFLDDIYSYRMAMPFGKNDSDNFEMLLDLVQASAAFPMAFSAYELKHCLLKPGITELNCSQKTSKVEKFIDGGIYQNSPVGRAYQVLKKEAFNAKKLNLFYINASAPLIAKHKLIPPKADRNDELGVFSDVVNVGLGFLKTSRTMTLSENLQRYPEMAQFTVTNQKSVPLASEPLYGFFGFVEKDFRIYDFYLGQIDGQKMFGSDAEKSLAANLEADCIKQIIESGDSNCELNSNLKSLARLSNERLKIYPEGEGIGYIFSFLEKENFTFKDLGLKKEQAHYGRVALKKRLTDLTNTLVEKQPEKSQNLNRFFFDQSLNLISYSPKTNYIYGLIGNSPEVGFSRAVTNEFNMASAWRFNSSLMLIGFGNYFGSAEDIWAPTPLLGVRYQPETLSSLFFQPSFGLRFGYQFSSHDDYGKSKCEEIQLKTYPGACSGSTAQLLTSFTFLESFRVQFVFSPDSPNQMGRFKNPEFFLQFGLLLESD